MVPRYFKPSMSALRVLVFAPTSSRGATHGQDPVDCIRKLKGRIFEVYLKDSSSPQETAAISDVLKELAQQKFKGAFCVQTAPSSGQELIKSLAAVVNGFSDVVARLAATAQ